MKFLAWFWVQFSLANFFSKLNWLPWLIYKQLTTYLCTSNQRVFLSPERKLWLLALLSRWQEVDDVGLISTLYIGRWAVPIIQHSWEKFTNGMISSQRSSCRVKNPICAWKCLGAWMFECASWVPEKERKRMRQRQSFCFVLWFGQFWPVHFCVL